MKKGARHWKILSQEKEVTGQHARKQWKGIPARHGLEMGRPPLTPGSDHHHWWSTGSTERVWGTIPMLQTLGCPNQKIPLPLQSSGGNEKGGRRHQVRRWTFSYAGKRLMLADQLHMSTQQKGWGHLKRENGYNGIHTSGLWTCPDLKCWQMELWQWREGTKEKKTQGLGQSQGLTT